MKAALAYEWIRLRTLRSTWWMLGISLIVTALLTLAFSGLILDLQAASGQGVSGTEAFIVVLTRSVLTPVVAGLIGVFAIAHDLRYGTIVTTLLVTPRRIVALAAKALVVSSAAATLALANLAVAWVAGLVVLRDRVSMDLALYDLVRAQLGFVLLVVGWSLIGLAFGATLLSQPASISALLVIPFLVEPTVRLFLASSSINVVRELAMFLPFAAGNAMLSGAEATTSALLGDSSSGLGPVAGGAVFLIFVTVLVFGAMASFRERDV